MLDKNQNRRDKNSIPVEFSSRQKLLIGKALFLEYFSKEIKYYSKPNQQANERIFSSDSFFFLK